MQRLIRRKSKSVIAEIGKLLLVVECFVLVMILRPRMRTDALTIINW
jgi:hypothetical protein